MSIRKPSAATSNFSPTTTGRPLSWPARRQSRSQYIATQFQHFGLKPAGDNGTYFQNIDFVGMKAQPDETTFSLVPSSGDPIPLKYADDYTVANQTLTPSVDIDAPIVFVGYGITAPEFNWDDYAGVDVKGKVIVCIVGDPPSDDPKFFAGKALTYYGRWTYKFEQAARKGAIGALIIHRTDLASYGWDVVKNSNTSEKTFLKDDKNPHLQAASWIQLDVAKKLFAPTGLDFDQLFDAAGKRGLQGRRAPCQAQGPRRQHRSSLPIAQRRRHPARPPKPIHDQAVLYTAHYDHLGFVAGPDGNPKTPGDNIYNGAADNATGVGMILELARVWSQVKHAAAPLRDLRRRHRRRAGPARLRISRPEPAHPRRPDRPRHQLRHDPAHRQTAGNRRQRSPAHQLLSRS